MWFLLLVIPAMSASPQLKYVESAIHFDQQAVNDNNNNKSTSTINSQEKAAALNSIYHNPAVLVHDHADHADHADHTDHADDDHKDCCCSVPAQSSPGLRIVNRPPKTNDGHYHHHHQDQEQHQYHQQHHHQPHKHEHQQKTCQPLACCKRKSQQVPKPLFTTQQSHDNDQPSLVSSDLTSFHSILSALPFQAQEALAALNVVNNQVSVCQSQVTWFNNNNCCLRLNLQRCLKPQAKVQRDQLIQLGRSLASYQVSNISTKKTIKRGMNSKLDISHLTAGRSGKIQGIGEPAAEGEEGAGAFNQLSCRH